MLSLSLDLCPSLVFMSFWNPIFPLVYFISPLHAFSLFWYFLAFFFCSTAPDRPQKQPSTPPEEMISPPVIHLHLNYQYMIFVVFDICALLTAPSASTFEPQTTAGLEVLCLQKNWINVRWHLRPFSSNTMCRFWHTPFWGSINFHFYKINSLMSSHLP